MSSRAFHDRVLKAAQSAEDSGTSVGRVIGETIKDVLDDEGDKPDEALGVIIEAELDAVVGMAEDVRAQIMGVRQPRQQRG